MDQTTPPSSPVVPSITSFEEAKAFLDTCKRWELKDHAFGDMEVGWHLNEVEVASGYFGGRLNGISIFNPTTHDEVWNCDGPAANNLRYAGTLSSSERNDSTGPDQYQEGRTMPGLTLEGVRNELTNS